MFWSTPPDEIVSVTNDEASAEQQSISLLDDI